MSISENDSRANTLQWSEDVLVWGSIQAQKGDNLRLLYKVISDASIISSCHSQRSSRLPAASSGRPSRDIMTVMETGE